MPAISGMTIDRRLGINNIRSEVLKCELSNIIFNGAVEQSKSGQPTDALVEYKKIAAICDDIHEFTMCIHLFMHFIAANRITLIGASNEYKM